MTACDDCLRRTDLIAALAGRLQVEFKQRDRARRACSRCPTRTCSSSARRADVRRALRGVRRARGRAARARAAGPDDRVPLPRRLPERLRDLADPPAVLHVLGDLAALRQRGRDRRRRRAARVVVRARGRAGARARAVGGAGAGRLRARAGRRLRGARRRARGARAARSPCSPRAPHVPYPARVRRLHAAVAGARRGDLGAAARARRRSAGASSRATGSSPRSARRRSSSRPRSAPAR